MENYNINLNTLKTKERREKIINTKKIYETIMLELMNSNASEQTTCETYSAVYNLMAKLKKCKVETNLNMQYKKRRKNDQKIKNNNIQT